MTPRAAITQLSAAPVSGKVRSHMQKIAALLVGLLHLAAPAAAEVSVENRALEPLNPRPAAAVQRPARPAAQPAKPASSKPVAAARPAPPPPLPPPIPPAPPPLPVVAPPPPAPDIPARPVLPPPPAPIVEGAESASAALPDGLRVTFASGRADLNPATADSVRAVARAITPNVTLAVTAYAAGVPEDPSTARRLSLSRALAVRSLLIGEGIASTRITVRALGPSATANAPTDRVDLTMIVPGIQQAATSDSVPGNPKPPLPAPAP